MGCRPEERVLAIGRTVDSQGIHDGSPQSPSDDESQNPVLPHANCRQRLERTHHHTGKLAHTPNGKET